MKHRLWILFLVGCEGDVSKAVDIDPVGEGAVAGECNDGVDNDGNDLTDCADPGCEGAPDCAGVTDNQAPSAPEVAVTPAEPRPGEALSCTLLTPGVDPEGEAVTHRFSWEVGGAGTTFTEADLPEGETGGEETWSCVAVADDGVQEGPEGRASVTTSRENSPPGVPVVEVVPAEPATNQPLRCDIIEDAVDPDGDPVSYRTVWLQGDVETDQTESTLGASQTGMGETWTCRVTATDGVLDGTPTEDSVTIGEARYSGDVSGLGGTSYSASSCFLGCDQSTYAPDNAFDDNPGTAGYSTWHATWTGGPEWIAVDFGAGNDKCITRYGLMGASFHEGYRVRDFSLQGSHDGEVWDTIDSVTDANLTYVMYGGEPFNYYEVEHDAAYRHWRYLITANEGGQPWANEVGIVEIELFEAEPVE